MVYNTCVSVTRHLHTLQRAHSWNVTICNFELDFIAEKNYTVVHSEVSWLGSEDRSEAWIPGQEIRNFGPLVPVPSWWSVPRIEGPERWEWVERRRGENTQVSPVTRSSGGGDISKCYVNMQTNIASSHSHCILHHTSYSVLQAKDNFNHL